MPATLQKARSTWQGVYISYYYDWQERPLGPAAQRIADEIKRLPKRTPVTVLLAAMERRGVSDPAGLLLDAIDQAPWSFLLHDGR